MEELVKKLLKRRERIRESIEIFARSDRRPFPKWVEMSDSSGEKIWIDKKWESVRAGRAHTERVN